MASILRTDFAVYGNQVSNMLDNLAIVLLRTGKATMVLFACRLQMEADPPYRTLEEAARLLDRPPPREQNWRHCRMLYYGNAGCRKSQHASRI